MGTEILFRSTAIFSRHRMGQATELSGVFLAFLLITVAFFWQEVAHLRSILIGPPEDNLQDFWNSWYAAVEAKPHGFFHTTLMRFPEGVDLSYHSFAYHHIAAVVALSKLFGTDRGTITLLHNMTILSSFPLAGLGAFLLVRRFSGSTLASLAGAFVFAFSPWHVGQAMHHAGVAQIGFIPFFVYFYLEALDRRSPAWLAAAILAYALSALGCWYYLFYLAFFMAFHGAYVWIRDKRRPAGWQLWAPLGAMAGAVLLLLPVLLPMLAGTGSERGNFRAGWYAFGMDPAAYLLPPAQHPFGHLTSTLIPRLNGNSWELAGYLGLINLGLVAWIWVKLRGDDTLRYVLAGMAVFMVLAAGVQLHLFGYNTELRMPDIVLSKLPVLDNLRTPSRCVVFVQLFLAIGVGYALSFLFLKARSLKGQALVAALLGLLFLDFVPSGLATTVAVCPKAFDIIRNDPEKGFGVADLPKTYAVMDAAMFEETCHGRPVVVAQIARVLAPSLMDRLDIRDLERQRQQLAQAHVKYIVLRPPSVTGWPKKAGLFPPYLKTYRTVARTDEFILLRVY